MFHHSPPAKYIFELLCIDPEDVGNEMSLAQALSFSNALWSGNTPHIETQNGKILLIEEKRDITIAIKLVDTSKVLTEYIDSAFIIRVTSNKFDPLEIFRTRILTHLRNTLKFSHIRLLADDISVYIANVLYPEINKIENLLRKYLTKFFIQRVGFDWFEATATKAMIEKVKLRKADRRDEISTLLDDDVRYLDFDDLGELIYKQSSGFNNMDKIMTRLLSISTQDELQTLQNELQGNYTKYFKKHFQDKQFEFMWKDLIRIRNKVAHQGTFFRFELEKGLETTGALTEIIREAERKIDEIVFSIEDKEAIRNAAIESQLDRSPLIESVSDEEKSQIPGVKIVGKLSEMQHPGQYKEKVIDEAEMLAELEEAETNKFNHFVGLRWFATVHLANKHFSIPATYMLINILIDKGKIERYEVTLPSGWPATAIRRKNAAVA